MPIIRYNTANVVAAAIIAFETNGSKIVKYNEINEDSSEISVVSNKNLINQHLTEPQFSNLVEQKLEFAKEMIDAISRRVTMNALVGESTNDFLKTVSDLLTRENIANTEFGISAWVPKLFNDMDNADNVRVTILSYCASSKFLGVDGKPIIVKFTPVIKRFLSQFGMWGYTGYDAEGNLISFTNKKELSMSEITISGRVKKHTESKKYANIPCTVLNYVKIV